jgi:hypothetical protein
MGIAGNLEKGTEPVAASTSGQRRLRAWQRPRTSTRISRDQVCFETLWMVAGPDRENAGHSLVGALGKRRDGGKGEKEERLDAGG